MGFLFRIGIICFLCVTFTVATGHITYNCNHNVQCIALVDCTGLYKQWEDIKTKEDKTEIIYLIKMLQCGVTNMDNQMPKVCCPADIYLSDNSVNTMATKNAAPVSDPASKLASKPASKLASKPLSELVNTTASTSTADPASKPTSKTTSKPDKTQNITCGWQNENKIYNGETTAIDEHPWTALLRYENGKKTVEYYCGGVLISSRHILTAAHCVNHTLGPEWKLTQVRLGEWNISMNPDCDDGCMNVTDVPIEEAIPHELFDPNDSNKHDDIAILRLSRDVKFNDYVQPICLPTTDLLNETFEGQSLEVAGWGKTEHSPSSGVKLKVSLEVNNQTICRDQYERYAFKKITEKQLCAGGRDGKDSCRGDSGNALMGDVGSVAKKWTAIGVVSYGPSPCGTGGWAGVYTRVSSYIEWIHENMRQ